MNNHQRARRVENVGVRKWIFRILSLVYVILFSINDYYNIFDECLVNYATVSVLCFVNASLFGWWWITTSAGASPVYRWALVIHIGVGITNFVNWIYRYDMLVTTGYRGPIFTSGPVWQYRLIPEALAFIWMFAFIVARICCSKLSIEDEE